MKRLFGLAVLTVATASFATTYDFDPAHSQARFTVRHMKFAKVQGEFKKFTGKAEIDPKDPTRSTVEVKIDASSIDTNNPDRDKHLKSAEFFNTDKCNDITFKQTKVAKGSGKDKFKVTGDLTMNCVTKPTTWDVELSPEMKGAWGEMRRVAMATTKVNRKDWNLTWNKTLEAGGVLVEDQVDLELVAELVPAQAPADAKDTGKKEGEAVKAEEKKTETKK